MGKEMDRLNYWVNEVVRLYWLGYSADEAIKKVKKRMNNLTK
jgi:hypothetical protein